jgi:ribose transport system permease protein
MSAVAATAPRSQAKSSDFGRVVLAWTRNYGTSFALVVLCVVFSITTPAFLTAANIRNLLQESGEPALIACGMTVVIIAGEFDLSVGAIFGFAGVVGAVVGNAAGVAAGVLTACLVGCGLGAINGVIVVRGRVQSFMATLATQFVFVGVAVYITRGLDNWQLHDPVAFGHLADATLGSVQNKAWIGLAGFLVIGALLRFTRFGRQVYAVGGNREAARVAGVRTGAVRVAVFVLSGGLAALAGILAVSDTGVAQADGGIGMEFTAITAVVIGGTSIAGGRGSVWRTLSGVLLLAVIANGLTLLYVNPTYNLLVQGTIILIAVVLDAAMKRRSQA